MYYCTIISGCSYWNCSTSTDCQNNKKCIMNVTTSIHTGRSSMLLQSYRSYPPIHTIYTIQKCIFIIIFILIFMVHTIVILKSVQSFALTHHQYHQHYKYWYQYRNVEHFTNYNNNHHHHHHHPQQLQYRKNHRIVVCMLHVFKRKQQTIYTSSSSPKIVGSTINTNTINRRNDNNTNIEFHFLSNFTSSQSLYNWIQQALPTTSTGTTKQHERDHQDYYDQAWNTECIPNPSNRMNNMNTYQQYLPTSLYEILKTWTLQNHISFLHALSQHSIGTIPTIIHYVQYITSTSHPHQTSCSKSIKFYIAVFDALLYQKQLQQQQSTQTNTTTALTDRCIIQNACIDVIKIMIHHSVLPSPSHISKNYNTIMSKCIQAYCGYTSYDPIQLYNHYTHLIQNSQQNIIWSESIFEFAILATAATTTTMTTATNYVDYEKYKRSIVIHHHSINDTIVTWECANQLYNEYIVTIQQQQQQQQQQQLSSNNTESISTIRKTKDYTIRKHQQSNQRIKGNIIYNNNYIRFPTERINIFMLQLCIDSRNVTNAITFINRFLSPQILLRTSSNNITTTTATESIVNQTYTTTTNTNVPIMTPRLWAMVLKVCTIVGDHTTSYQILYYMNQHYHRPYLLPNLRHCTAYIKSLIVAKELNKAIQFLDYMVHGIDTSSEQLFRNLKLLQVQPDMITIKAILNGCYTIGNYAIANDICTKIKNGYYGNTIQMDEQCYNMLLSTCNDTIIAKQIIREMQLTRRHRYNVIQPSILTYTKAIAICRNANDIDTAKLFLSMAKNDNIVLDTFIYTSVIWVAAKCKDADVALEILNEMIRNDHSSTTPTIVSYNGVYSALASNGRIETIVETFQNMKHTYPHIKPNYMTFFHISRCLQKVKEEEERLAFLWRIFILMDSHDRQMKIGSRLIETLIQTYGALGHVHEAIHAFESINGLSDCACLRAIIFACSNSDPPEWKRAVSYFHSNYIGKCSNYIDSGMLCNTMLACSKAGQWEESLQLLRSYSDQCMDISIVAINSLIAACGRAGRPDMSMEILYEVEGWGISLDTRSYRNAIIACNQAEHVYRRSLQKQQQQQSPGVSLLQQTFDDTELGFEWWECAISLLRRMKENGIQPDTHTLSSTISACEAAGQWQYALLILQSAMDDSTRNENSNNALNLYCFNAAIAACEKGGAWVEALDIYESMKSYGGNELRPNIITINSLIVALDTSGQKEFAIHIYREGIKKQYIPSPWRYTKDSINTDLLIYAMDLHSYSAAMARAAIRDYMDTIVDRSSHYNNVKITNTTVISGDCIIIVGQGYHSIDRRPILKDTVMNVLYIEYGIQAMVDETNFGRVRIKYNDLQQYILQHQW